MTWPPATSTSVPARVLHWTPKWHRRSVGANRCCSITGRRRRCWGASNWWNSKSRRSM